MSNTITIDGVEYKNLEIVSITIDGKEKLMLSEEDTKDKNDLSVNIVVKSQ